MRAFEFLLEADLSPSELKKYDTRPGQFADLINNGFVFKNRDGQDVVFNKVDKNTLIKSITTHPARQSFTLPGKVAGKDVLDINTASIVKPAEMRGAKGHLEAEKKKYNIGDIGEALMGLCVTGRLFNEGNAVKESQILAFWPFIQ